MERGTGGDAEDAEECVILIAGLLEIEQGGADAVWQKEYVAEDYSGINLSKRARSAAMPRLNGHFLGHISSL
ncbi:MAG: hypothetical protein ACOX6I_02900 [Syntrophomonadaceae bacterium]|jgi:hypothetical protein